MVKMVKRQKGLAAIKLEAHRRANTGSVGYSTSRRQSEQGFVRTMETLQHPVEAILAEKTAQRLREIDYTPDEARTHGKSYQGPIMDDKGLRDGSCNRTACQVPLAGQPRWSMPNYTAGGRLYYCQRCVDLFHESGRGSCEAQAPGPV